MSEKPSDPIEGAIVKIPKDELRLLVLGPLQIAIELHKKGLMDDKQLMVMNKGTLETLQRYEIEPLRGSLQEALLALTDEGPAGPN